MATFTSVATDNFNRSTPLGANWTNTESASNDIRINGSPGTAAYGAFQQPVTGNSFGSYVWAGAGSFNADQYSEVAVSGVNQVLSTSWFGGVSVGDQGTDDPSSTQYGVGVCADSAGGTGPYTIALVKRLNNVTTTLHSATSTWSNGDRLGISRAVVGGNAVLRVWQNRVALSAWDTTDSSSPILTGKPGLIASGNLGTPVLMDDWEGGNYSAANANGLVNIEHTVGRGAFRGQY